MIICWLLGHRYSYENMREALVCMRCAHVTNPWIKSDGGSVNNLGQQAQAQTQAAYEKCQKELR